MEKKKKEKKNIERKRDEWWKEWKEKNEEGYGKDKIIEGGRSECSEEEIIVI